MTQPAMQTRCGALRADSDYEEGIGRRGVAREGEAGAGLVGRDAAEAEGAIDFGCAVGAGK